jgi:hypothetical protein
MSTDHCRKIQNMWWLIQASLVSYSGMVHGSFPGKDSARGSDCCCPA